MALVPGESYTFKKELPLGTLYVKRYLSVREGKKWLTYQVWFTGLSKGVFAKALGKNYRKMLPSVMERISLLAQNQYCMVLQNTPILTTIIEGMA